MALTLRGNLEDALYKFEWPPRDNQYYIPINVLDEFVTIDAVSEELQKDFPLLEASQIIFYAKYICTSAKKVYAILLCIDKSKTICDLIKDGISDQDLPFLRSDIAVPLASQTPDGRFELCTAGHSRECLRHRHTGCGIKTLTTWSAKDLRNLSRDQWQVLIPTFEPHRNGKIPHMDFDQNTIFPYVEDHLFLQDSPPKGGGYSHVWGVRIHWAHQKIYHSTDPNVTILHLHRNMHADSIQILQPLLAIKRPFSRDIRDFKREANMLSTLALRSHPHLIKLLATYKYKDDYHFIFPYANTNLRGYWNDTGLPYRNRDTYLWFMQQICGLTSGVNAIHNFKTEESLPLDTVKSAPNLRVSVGEYLTVAPEEKRFGRHGDIKPENILWSNELKESKGEEGILQLTDMGCGRFHRLESRSGIDATGISGSPTYAPPEVCLEKLVSRSYDIWSLGCVFVEFVTWLIEGNEMVYEFASARNVEVKEGWFDDLYYEIITPDSGLKYAVVRQGVKDWFNRLRNHARCSDMLKDVLDLVERRMLVIDANDRIRCYTLVTELEKIMTKAEGNASYLIGKYSPIDDPDIGVKLPRGNNTKYAPTSATETDVDSCTNDESRRLAIAIPGIILSNHDSNDDDGPRDSSLIQDKESRRSNLPKFMSTCEPPIRTTSFPETPMPRTSKPGNGRITN